MPTMGPAGHDSVEWIAALILVIGGAIAIAIAFRTRSSPSGPTAARIPAPDDPTSGVLLVRHALGRTPPAERSLVLMLAGLSGGAGIIHLVAAPGHVAEIGDLAGGFVAAALFQLLWIRWCLAGPSRRTAVIGIAGNLAIIGAWAWTRIIGLPLGELASVPEPVGYPDGVAVLFEVALIGGLLVRAFGLDRFPARRDAVRTLASIAVIPTIGLVLVLTSLATLAIATGTDHGGPAVTTMPAMEHVATE